MVHPPHPAESTASNERILRSSMLGAILDLGMSTAGAFCIKTSLVAAVAMDLPLQPSPMAWGWCVDILAGHGGSCATEVITLKCQLPPCLYNFAKIKPWVGTFAPIWKRAISCE